MAAQLYVIHPCGTAGSRRVNEYCNRNNVVRVTWEITPRIDASLRAYEHEYNETRSALITNACAMFTRLIARRVGIAGALPVNFEERAKKATWYAPRELHTTLRHYSVDSGHSLQQIIDYAVELRYPVRSLAPS
jgi:hypothetical protein